MEYIRQYLMDLNKDFENKDFNRENQCKITVFNGVDAGKSFLLNNDCGELRIGRLGDLSLDDSDYENDIKLSNEYEDVTEVSKPHALLKSVDGKWFIHDGDKTNGTYVNNSTLEVSSKLLNNKDVIKLALGKKGVSLLCSLN